MPKNLGSISDPKDIVTVEYLENNYISKLKTPRLVVGNTIVSSPVSTIAIPDNIDGNRDVLIYHNGLLIVNQVNYIKNTDSITLLSYDTSPGDIFTFIDIVIE